MYSISADEAKWPKVAAHHYIRNITRRRVLVVLPFVLCFFFWQAMKRPFPEELEGLMLSPKGRRSPQWSEENQVKHQVQQQELSQAAVDWIRGKTSESSALRTTFPEYSEFVALNSMADALPDVIHIPFEDATADVTLTGWEDEWFSKVEYDVEQWGSLSEPKIDFIYSCKSTFQHVYTWC